MTNQRTGQTQQNTTKGSQQGQQGQQGQQDDTQRDDTQKGMDSSGTGRTRQDAGRMGGEVTKEKYGSDHFSNIGAMGGRGRTER